MQHVVLACRATAEGASPASRYLEGARELVQLAQAHGATLVAWGERALAFAFACDGATGDRAIDLAAALGRGDGELAWSCALAQGELEPIDAPASSRETTRALAPHVDLSWGPPLAAAMALARIARPREVLLDESLEALRAGELLKLGGRRGKGALSGLRGARLDTRAPRKADCAARVASMVEPPLLGRGDIALAIDECPGALSLVRAAPGYGGTRVLAEVAVVAPAALLVRPVGLGVEPLGALRHALAAARAELLFPEGLKAAADQLFAGEGVVLETAAALVLFALQAPSPRPSALLIDDAHAIDEASLAACALALERSSRPLFVVARLGAEDPVPAPLSGLPVALEFSLDALEAGYGEELAMGCTGGAMARDACRRWARRGGQSPLGIVEAIACGLSTGELLWTSAGAFARRRHAGNGRPRPAEEWIVRRAEELPAEARAVLSALAILGGAASWETLDAVLSAVGAKVATPEVVPRLVAARWVRVFAPEPRESAHSPGAARAGATLSLPSRTHREVVRELVSGGRRRAWHRAAAQTLVQTAGPLGLAEASQHAFEAGDAAWAARLADEAASAASRADLAASCARLRAFARACEPLGEGDAAPFIQAIPSSRPVDSDRTLASPGPFGLNDDVDRAVESAGPITQSSGPPSEEELLTERMHAIEELSHGQAAHAVDVLRHAHEKLVLAHASSSALCQASLVLGVAIAHAGSPEEALLQGLDALARAREGKDAPGERACVRFLLTLFEATSRGANAVKLRAAASAAPVG